MKNLDLAVVDGIEEYKTELVQKHLLPFYALNHTRYAIPSQIQGQINSIHSCLTALAGDLSGPERALVVMAGSFLEGLENDLKHYRIEGSELNL